MKIKAFIFLLVLLWIVILVSDTKVFIWEDKVNPGQKYFVDDYGELGKAGQSQLVGRYFNGRKIITRVFWYSPNNFIGRDSCPFLLLD
jgi:hypothetical protein